jgi:hypothetical protein
MARIAPGNPFAFATSMWLEAYMEVFTASSVRGNWNLLFDLRVSVK